MSESKGFSYGDGVDLNQIDEVYDFVSPTAVLPSSAFTGEGLARSAEGLVIGFEAAKAALIPYHPDNQKGNFDNNSVEEGRDLFIQANRIAGFAVNDTLEIARDFKGVLLNSDQGEELEKFYANRWTFHQAELAIRAIKDLEPITFDGRNFQLGGGLEIMAITPEEQDDIRQDGINMLSLVLSEKTLKAILNLKRDDFVSAVSSIQKKLSKFPADSEGLKFGYTESEINGLMESLKRLGPGKIDDLSTDNVDTLHNLENQSWVQAKENSKKLIGLMKPNSKLKYPENWWRSFSGTCVLPDARYVDGWPNYSQDIANQLAPEIGDLLVYDVKNGIITAAHDVYTGDKEFISRVDDLPPEASKPVQDMIKDTAKNLEYDGFIEKISKELIPMDFVFRIDSNSKGKAVFTRPIKKLPKSAGGEFDFSGSGLDPGFYIIKAGRVKGKYRKSDPRIALLKLEYDENTMDKKSALGFFINEKRPEEDDDMSPNSLEWRERLNRINKRGAASSDNYFMLAAQTGESSKTLLEDNQHSGSTSVRNGNLVLINNGGLTRIRQNLPAHDTRFIKN